MIENKTLALKNGKSISYAEYGDPGGKPIIGFHGMPGSRLMMKLLDKTALNFGARIIAPERPGYGLSQPSSNGTLLKYTDDILELANTMEFTEFAVLGVSGGGPYGLACAYTLSHRLTVTAIVSGIGPLRLPNSTKEMLFMNKIMFNLGRLAPRLVGFLLPRLLRTSLRTMERHVEQGASPTPNITPEVFAIMTADQREAILTGGQGIIFDMKNLWRPWGFQLEDIPGKVYLWHGQADNLAPSILAHYVADHLPNCESVFYPEEGHSEPLTKHLDEIIGKIVNANSIG